MIRWIRTDLFASTAQTLVNPVNTCGAMGKGLALAFRRRFPPSLFEDYALACRRGDLRIGTLHLWRRGRPWVLCFPTKTDWRSPSRVEYLEAGLRRFAESYRELGISSAAFPLLGCGLGGLAPTEVRELLKRYLSPLPIPLYVHLLDDRVPHLP